MAPLRYEVRPKSRSVNLRLSSQRGQGPGQRGWHCLSAFHPHDPRAGSHARAQARPDA
jgi:hypothetical protein